MVANLAALRVLLEAALAAAGQAAGFEKTLALQASLVEYFMRFLCDDSCDGPSPCMFTWACGPAELHFKAARLLLAAAPIDAPLVVLNLAPQNFRATQGKWEERVAYPLYPTLAANRPLIPTQWERIPRPFPGLGAALPTVLARPSAEPALLVARLAEGERQRLRGAALCLARSQREAGVELPGPLLGRILALALAP